MNIGPTWTDERLAGLKRYAAAGLSGSQIAEQLGGLSRSAVIAKARRMGVHITSYEEKRELGLLPPARKRKPTAIDPSLRFACTIMGLGDETCRWPMGEPTHDMLYCGAPTAGYGPYCAWHTKISCKPAWRRD